MESSINISKYLPRQGIYIILDNKEQNRVKVPNLLTGKPIKGGHKFFLANFGILSQRGGGGLTQSKSSQKCDETHNTLMRRQHLINL